MPFNDKPDWLKPSFSLFGLTLIYASGNSNTKASWTNEPDEDHYFEYGQPGTVVYAPEGYIRIDDTASVWWLNKTGDEWIFDEDHSTGTAAANNVPDWSDALVPEDLSGDQYPGAPLDYAKDHIGSQFQTDEVIETDQ